jgi:hypothetical protein
MNIFINGKRTDKNTFKQGFVAGWLECAGDPEPNQKIRLRAMAEVAFQKFLKDHGIVEDG